MNIRHWTIVLLLLVLVAGMARPVEEDKNRIRRRAPLTTEKQLVVEVGAFTGNFYLYPGDADVVYDLSLHYENSAPVVTYNRMGERGYLNIKAKSFSKEREENPESEEVHFNLKDQDCELYVTPAIPVDLRLKFDVVRGELELGGLKLENLELNAGVSKVLVAFSQPNPIPLEVVRIQAGVGKLRMQGLGNANFQRLEFEGGIGTSVLDFSGDFHQNARLQFDVGIGKVTLRLPRTIGVRVKINKSFLSSVDIDDVYKKGGYYYNDKWGKAPASMDIRINAGIGKVSIEWID